MGQNHLEAWVHFFSLKYSHSPTILGGGIRVGESNQIDTKLWVGLVWFFPPRNQKCRNTHIHPQHVRWVMLESGRRVKMLKIRILKNTYPTET